MNKVRVNLAQRNQRPLAALPDGAKLRKKCGPILFHRPLRILASEAEIQAFSAIDFGKSARSSAEAINEPGRRRERFGPNDLVLRFPQSFQRHGQHLNNVDDICNASPQQMGSLNLIEEFLATFPRVPLGYGYNLALRWFRCLRLTTNSGAP